MAREKKEGNDMEDWWEDRSMPEKVAAGIGLGILGIAFFALCGWVVMSLWNWLMPEIFGLTTIDYWQTWGLILLSMVFFHGMGSGESGRRRDRKRKRHLRRSMQEADLSTADDVPPAFLTESPENNNPNKKPE